MHIRVKNQTGIRKEIKIGTSWTFVLFGVFVPLFRGDWKWFGITFGTGIILTLAGLDFIIPFLIGAFGVFYNKLYAKDLYEEGYRGISYEENAELEEYIEVDENY